MDKTVTKINYEDYLDYQNKFDFTLASIRNQLSDLKNVFEKIGSDMFVARQVSSLLRERVTNLQSVRAE